MTRRCLLGAQSCKVADLCHCPTRMTRLDVAAIEAVWQQTRRSVEEYREHPSAGRYADPRKPCLCCAKPTYAKTGTCNACKKGDRP